MAVGRTEVLKHQLPAARAELTATFEARDIWHIDSGRNLGSPALLLNAVEIHEPPGTDDLSALRTLTIAEFSPRVNCPLPRATQGSLRADHSFPQADAANILRTSGRI